MACRILSSPTTGIEPLPLAVKAQSPNHWTAREYSYIKLSFDICDILMWTSFLKSLFYNIASALDFDFLMVKYVES